MYSKLTPIIKKSMYIVISLLSFFIAFLTIKVQFVKNFEYQLTDAAKFALKDQKKYSIENRDLVNSEIIILGITEASQFHYLNKIYGQYPWSREAYSDFLRYFRLDEPNLYPLKEEVEELKLVTWNSIRPDMLFFDIFFDSQRNTKLSFQDKNITKDFGGLISKLSHSNKNTNVIEILKEWTSKKKYESDYMFYNELKRQQKHNYIFFDYIIGEGKEGRLSEQDIKDRFSYLQDWELTNVYNQNGKKIDDPHTKHLNDYPFLGLDLKLPLKDVIKSAAGTGAANIHPDQDGKNRKIPLIYRVYDERVMSKPIFLPTINLMMAAKYYDIKPKDIIVNIGKSITLENALIKNRIYYTRKDKYDREYRWSQYIDEFMEQAIDNITRIKNDNKIETIKYTDIVNILIKDKQNLKILKEKYKKNNLQIKINPSLYKKEIEDFLRSLSLTSFYAEEPFFELENNVFTEINTEKLSDYMKLLKNRYNILRHLVKKEADNNKTDILFIDNKTPRISIKDVEIAKKSFFDFIARLNTSFRLYDNNKIMSYNTALYKEDIISKEDNPTIANLDEIIQYRDKVKDNLFKRYIDYLIVINKLPSIVEELKSKGLIYYQEKDKHFFDISIIDSNLAKLIYLDEASREQENVLNKLYSVMGVNSNKNKKNIKNILLYISGGYSNSTEQDLELFYNSLKEGYGIEQEFVKKTIDTLREKGLILYKENKSKITLLEVIDLKKVNEYKDNEILNLNHRKIVQSLIEGAERLKIGEGEKSRYYTFDIKEILDYLYDKTKLKKDTIKNILSTTTINKIVGGDIKTIEIKVTDKDLGVKEPHIVIDYIDRLRLQTKIIEQLIEIKKKHSSLLNGLSSKAEHKLYLYETLLQIGKSIDVHPANILIEIEYLLLDPRFMEAVQKIDIEDKDKIIRINTTILNSYLNKKIDINIPINAKGEMIINYQGSHKSFENTHFGKYMSTSRLRYAEGMEQSLPSPFNTPEETPHLNWELFKNKIVFVGFYTTSALGQSRDYFETPYGTLFGVEIHANALNTLLKRDFISDLPGALDLVPPINFSKQTKIIWFILSFVIMLVFVYYERVKDKNIKNLLKQLPLPLLLFSIFSYSLFYILNNGVSIDYEIVIMLLFSLLFGFTLSKMSIARGFVTFIFISLLYFVFVIFYAFSILKINIPIVGTSINIIYTFIAISVYKLIVEEKEKRKIKNMFSKYVSPELVKQLVASSKKELQLGGEDKEITVLFSDIRKFTSISENLKPYELVAHLNVYFTDMTDIIQKHNGTLDKYIGDAIMAFWGAPLEIKEHALLSCKAAIDMINRVNKLNQSWPADRRFNIGIGINTGTMTVGNIGSLSRMDYTIMGDSVNLCSRVEGANKLYGTAIIITEYTYALVKDNVIVRELDLIKVVGKEKPVRIYELLDIIKK